MDITKNYPLFALSTLLFVFAACTSNEIGESKDVAQDKIYQSYNINYFEEDSKLDIFAQFRFAGSNGTTLVLSKPSQVNFDGYLLRVDSTAGRGAFYFYTPEKSINTLYGKHRFVFTNTDNKKLVNDFSFDSFKLINVPDTVSKQQPFNLNFETAALQNDDYIEVGASYTDSSFIITHNAANGGSSIIIPAIELQRQKGKELTLEATLYRKISLQENTTEGGEIAIRYSLNPVKIKLTE